MDSATKSSKPTSNISDIVHRFTKVCRLRSVGVYSNENPKNHNNHHHNKIIIKNNNNQGGGSNEVGSDDTEDTECSDQKIHPQPIEETLIKTHEDIAAIAILKLFDTVSALKLAYIQLQEAHIPYDPERIQAADDRIVTELKTLCDIKKSFKNITRHNSSSSFSGPIMVQKLQDHEFQIQKLQSQIQGKDIEILKLKQEVLDLDKKNKELDSMIKEKPIIEKSHQPKTTLTDAFASATKSIHDFAKPLISLIKASGWDLDLAANSIEDSINYSKRFHKKYAFETYISRRMFHGYSEFESYNLDGILRFEDPFDALVKHPDSEFAKFCRSKYLLIVHSRMETAFFGNLDQKAFILNGGHPRTPLYQAFVKMAKSVWVLQAMAASNKAEIFGVQRGTEFSEIYMDDVVEDNDDTIRGKSVNSSKVGFMVMPGFKIGQTLIKSKVYLTS